MHHPRLLAIVMLSLLAASCSTRAESLEDAWGAALAQNAQFATSQLEAAATEHELGAAQAQWWPEARVQASYTVRTDEQSFRFSNPLLPDQVFVSPYMQQEYAASAVSVKAPVYTSGRIENSVKAAEERRAAAVQGVNTSRSDLMLAVGKAYLAVLRARRELEVAQQNLTGLAAHEAEMGRAFAEGRLTERELLSAQAAKTASDQSVRAADYRCITAEAHFNRLLARPLDSPVLLDEVAIPKHACSLEELQHIATTQRADLSQLESILRSRVYDAERLRRETNPQVAVVGRLGYEENRFQTPQAIGSAAVVLDWNFFDGSRSRALAEAELSRAASVGRLIDDLRSQINLELLTAWNDREEAAYRTTAAWQSLQQAEEHLRVSTLRHQQGLNVQSDVLEAHAQRTRAAKDFHAARYDLTEAQLRLRHAAGILGQ